MWINQNVETYGWRCTTVESGLFGTCELTCGLNRAAWFGIAPWKEQKPHVRRYEIKDDKQHSYQHKQKHHGCGHAVTFSGGAVRADL